MNDAIALIGCASLLGLCFWLMRKAVSLPLRIRHKKYMMDGEKLPFGFGYAYFDYPRMAVVAYPLGLNLIAYALRAVWQNTLRWRPTSRDIEILTCKCVAINLQTMRCPKCGLSPKQRELIR